MPTSTPGHEQPVARYWVSLPLIQAHQPPLFLGLRVCWRGEGRLGTGVATDVVYFWQEHLDGNVNPEGQPDPHVLRSSSSLRYDRSLNPASWPDESWTSFYAANTGDFIASSAAFDPGLKWGNPWFLPYRLQLKEGNLFSIAGQVFTLSGPHPGFVLDQAMLYWQMVNRDAFLFWEGDAEQEYVQPGDIRLRYDAGHSRLLLGQEITRRMARASGLTGETIRYTVELQATNAFSPGTYNCGEDVQANAAALLPPGETGYVPALSPAWLPIWPRED
jgi:hypothetical protein